MTPAQLQALVGEHNRLHDPKGRHARPSTSEVGTPHDLVQLANMPRMGG